MVAVQSIVFALRNFSQSLSLKREILPRVYTWGFDGLMLRGDLVVSLRALVALLA